MPPPSAPIKLRKKRNVNAAADVGVAGRDQRAVGDREGHFRHPTEVCAGLRSHRHLTYYVGQLERGPKTVSFSFYFCQQLSGVVLLSVIQAVDPVHAGSMPGRVCILEYTMCSNHILAFFCAGLLHYHFLLEFAQPVELSSVQGLFGDGSGAHCELVQGTFEQCKAYVTKDSDRVAGTSILRGCASGSGQAAGH